MHRVVVTGLGCISPLGHSAAAHWYAAREGRSGIAQVSHVPPEKLNIRVAAEVKGFDPERHFDAKKLALLDRFSQFAVVAAREAVADAGLELTGEVAADTAVVFGSGVGGMTTLDDSFLGLYGRDMSRVHPLAIPRLMLSAAASHITMDLGITGPGFAVSSACSSANHAIGEAFWMLRTGRAKVAVTGGSEACITFGTMRGWEALRVMASDTCRPFSRNRRGMVIGEGAAVFVLETLEAARARGAPIYAEIAGFGMTSDAGDLVAPSEIGAAGAIAKALQDAGLAADAVDYVNAHGTGTPMNDVTETRALRRVFGADAERLAVSSTKSVHGHALGAAGALELVATVLAMHEGVIPPTANFTEPDPACDLDYVPNQPRERRIRAALSNSFAFGGLNAVLALRRLD